MNKKGFTLIELLAVIILLAIVALIAVPKILDVINDAKESAANSSMLMFIKGGEYLFADSLVNPSSILNFDGETNLYNEIQIAGNHPEVGSQIAVNSIGEVRAALIYEGSCYMKNYGSKDITVTIIETQEDKESCNLGELKDPVKEYEDESGASSPLKSISEGIIPVTIANDGTVTVVNTSTKWYDYNNKIWANGILVKETARILAIGDIISEEDILAYFVWIPRYKYQILPESTGTNNEQIITIQFESASTQKSIGTEVGEWITHPAFTFGSEELSGIWVAKFETTGNGELETDVVENFPTIKPNEKSRRWQSVSNQFTTSLNFENALYYGLSGSGRTSLMKNSEWGALAYLSHSIYGVGEEIFINSNNSYYTGCGAIMASANSTSYCENEYGTQENYPQSTTGNISGVFDTSGGANEYVMGYLTENYNLGNYSGFSTLPEEKYFDVYKTTTLSTSCDGICYGHALSETAGWYSDQIYFFNASYPWLMRGGYFENNLSAGTFRIGRAYGDDYGNIGYRIVVR